MMFRVLLFLRKIIYLSLGLFDRVLQRQNPLFILSYHSVAEDDWRFSVDLNEIKKQINYLSERFDFITLKDLEKYRQGKKKLTKPSVVLTFDDGYKDVLRLKSYFKQKHITPTLFLLANTKNPNWKELATKRAFLTKKDIARLIKENWEIGCHSATHANLATLTKKEIDEEVITAKKLLEKELGIPVAYFAYPRGKYSEAVLRTVKKAGYVFGLTMDDGFITKQTNQFALPRIGIDRTHSFAEFPMTFSPSVVALRKLIKKTVVERYL